jgi:hypothetical protein
MELRVKSLELEMRIAVESLQFTVYS